MGFISEFLAKRFRPPTSVFELHKKINELEICVDFVIEAGAHEGTDTKSLLKIKGVKKIYCFEPNPNSFKILSSKMVEVKQQDYEIFNLGLFERNTKAKLFFPKIDLGGMNEKNAGTSSLLKNWAKSDGEFVEVDLVSLDSFFGLGSNFMKSNKGLAGLLWLDVEGAALQALFGMKSTLGFIDVAKIEVEYGVQKNQWNSKNLFKVIRFLRAQGFTPISGYLHPLTRGDMLFVRKKQLALKLKVKSLIFQSLLLTFYGFIYPLRSSLRE
jgi:FkbM family methyltransferase